jgi:hypothetical protein
VVGEVIPDEFVLGDEYLLNEHENVIESSNKTINFFIVNYFSNVIYKKNDINKWLRSSICVSFI